LAADLLRVATEFGELINSMEHLPAGSTWALRGAICRGVAAVIAAFFTSSLQAAEQVDYARQVKPVFAARCVGCHGVLQHKADLRLDTGAMALRGGDDGPAIVAGKASASPLIERVMARDPAIRMPPEGAALSAEQVAILRAWIDQGAKSPADEPAEADPRTHWSFRRVVRPGVPRVKDQAWVRNPIDAFVAFEREKRGLGHVGPAEPDVLLRRVTLDLTGLPPTRQELRDFLRDPSDAAYEHVVDRLLASPRYGERWGRHWMDVWRYSDWYGRRAVPDVLNSYAQIWRWRDWIVKSLDHDRGYDQMVREMLAADELAPGDNQAAVATGFLVRNWFRWNTNLWMRDNVEHTGKAFLGLTMNCAHCHDHKYDPIKHDDYFAFRAFFEPLELRHDRIPGEPDPGPYPKYVFGSAYPPIRSGMVRVFDDKPDAPTFFYTGGESRNVVAGRKPIAAGVPAILGGPSLRIEPVDLPVEVSHPWLETFVIREERQRRQAAIVEAERKQSRSVENSTSLARAAAELDRAKAVAARSDLEAFEARLAADLTRYGKQPGDWATLRKAAVFAERKNAIDAAAVGLAAAELKALESAGKPPAVITKAASSRADAARKLEEARAVAAREVGPTEYTPLGPVFPSRSSGKRAALARWITDRQNPLSARVAVNHIWRWHFGTGLVETTYDFGRNGKPPTHPELLEWLATELMEPTSASASPWSMKAMHRLLVTSASYRMGSRPSPTSGGDGARDAERNWYGRFSASRMEAEEVRDGVLHASGMLDPAMFGPDIDHALGMTSRRRSLYFTHQGESRMAFLELFDAADACDGYRRTASIVPQQALAIVNNAMLVELSGRLADRLWTEVTAEGATAGGPAIATRFIDAAFEQVLSRRATAAEQALCETFLRKQADLLASSPAADARARADLIHALFSHHDFVTIH
jgi:mono/diheme cytochrome c family protein